MRLVQQVRSIARQSSATHTDPPQATAARAARPKKGTLQVVVVDQETRLPVDGAEVRVGRKRERTQQGLAVFTDIPAGSHLTVVTHSCYPEWRQERVPVAADQTTTVKATLEHLSLKQAANQTNVGGKTLHVGTRVGRNEKDKLMALFGGDTNAVGAWVEREVHSIVYATFWNSLAPDKSPPLDNRPVVFQQNLGLVQYRFNDDGTIWSIVKDKNVDFEVTPLVWPKPTNTPGVTEKDAAGNEVPAAVTEWPDAGWPGKFVLARAKNTTGTRKKKRIREAIDEVQRKHIEVCMAHDEVPQYGQQVNPCKGKLKHWVVANEVLELWFKSAARNHAYWKRYGLWEKDEEQIYQHVLSAFKVARAQDPKAKLILNDYNMEGINPDIARSSRKPPFSNRSDEYRYWKPRIFRRLALRLKEDLKRLYGARWVRDCFYVGFQMHVPLAKRKYKGYLAWMILNNLNYYKRKKINVRVTEFDIVQPKGQAPPPPEKQYKIYRNLYAAMVLGGCKFITAWGVFDFQDNFHHNCMFSETPAEGCTHGGPPYRKRAYHGAVTGVRYAHQLRKEIKQDR